MRAIPYRFVCLCGVLVLLGFFSGCETTVVSERAMQETSISVRSEPSGALVLAFAERGEFCETNAFVLGKTPLRRFQNIPVDGLRVCVSKRGYEEWTGVLSPANPNASIQLKPLASGIVEEREKQQKIILVPARVGIRKIGSESTALEKSLKAEEYRNTIIREFGAVILEDQNGVSDGFKVADIKLGQTLWAKFEEEMKTRCYERIPHYPIPIRLNLSQSERARLPAQEGLILLLRAEAYYTGTAKKAAKTALPIAMTVLGAVASVNSSPAYSHTSTSGSLQTKTSYHIFPVFGFSPSEDTIVVQEVLLDCATLEIKWAGQLQVSDSYGRTKSVEALARQAAQLVPDEYIAGVRPKIKVATKPTKTDSSVNRIMSELLR